MGPPAPVPPTEEETALMPRGGWNRRRAQGGSPDPSEAHGGLDSREAICSPRLERTACLLCPARTVRRLCPDREPANGGT